MRLRNTTSRYAPIKIGVSLFWIVILSVGIARNHNHLLEAMRFGWLVILVFQLNSAFRQRA